MAVLAARTAVLALGAATCAHAACSRVTSALCWKLPTGDQGCPAEYGKALCLRNACNGEPWCKFSSQLKMGRGLCQCECGWCAVPPSKDNGWKWSCRQEEGVATDPAAVEEQKKSGKCPSDYGMGGTSAPSAARQVTGASAEETGATTASPATSTVVAATPAGATTIATLPATTAGATTIATLPATTTAAPATTTVPATTTAAPTTATATTTTPTTTTATTLTTTSVPPTTTTPASTSTATTTTALPTTSTTVTTTLAADDDRSWMAMRQAEPAAPTTTFGYFDEGDVFAGIDLDLSSGGGSSQAPAPTTAAPPTPAPPPSTTARVASTTAAPIVSTQAAPTYALDAGLYTGSDYSTTGPASGQVETTAPEVFWRLYNDAPGRRSGGSLGVVRRRQGRALPSLGAPFIAALACTGLLGLAAAHAVIVRHRRTRLASRGLSLTSGEAKEPIVESDGRRREELAEVAGCLPPRDEALE